MVNGDVIKMDEMMKAFLHGARRGSPTADWVEWVHRSRGKTHCETCLKLDKCWFMNANKPELPQHPFCHCETMPIPYSRVLDEANAQSAYSKYDPYLFDTMDYYKHGKNKAFESWGYSVDDSAWLKKEIEKQALRKYVAGEYSLGKLNKDGQRISIRVEIPRKNESGNVSFITGWMVYPNGRIQLSTPYGGK